MPSVPVPPELDEFLAKPNPAVVATLRPDGSPHTAATWYDWEDGRVLLNMADPRVSLTVLAEQDWYRHVSLMGRIVSIEEDVDLRDIDRLAVRYTRRPYGKRDVKRFSAWLEPQRWHVWPPR